MHASYILVVFLLLCGTLAQLLEMASAIKGTAAIGSSAGKLATAIIPSGLLVPLAIVGPLKFSLPFLLGLKGLGVFKVKLLLTKAPLLAPTAIAGAKFGLLKTTKAVGRAKIGLIELPLKLAAAKLGAVTGAVAGAKAGLASYATFPKSSIFERFRVPAATFMDEASSYMPQIPMKTITVAVHRSQPVIVRASEEPEAQLESVNEKPALLVYTPAPPAYTPAPLAYTRAPPAYTPVPPAYTPVPPAYTPAPSVYTRAPPAYTPAPPVYTPAPPVYTHAPPVYTPAPPAYTPAPPALTPAPLAYTPAPPAYTPAPPVYTPAPPAYTPAPRAYTPAPPAYAPTPLAYLSPTQTYVSAPRPVFRRPRDVDQNETVAKEPSEDPFLIQSFLLIQKLDVDHCVRRVICEIAVEPDVAEQFGAETVSLLTQLDNNASSPWHPYKEAMMNGTQLESRDSCHQKYPKCVSTTDELVRRAMQQIR